jgi:hypothetical protein
MPCKIGHSKPRPDQESWGKSASNVMALLHEKYRTGLIAAIAELRARY